MFPTRLTIIQCSSDSPATLYHKLMDLFTNCKQKLQLPLTTKHGHRSWVNRIWVRLRRDGILIHKLDCHILWSSIWTRIKKQDLKRNYQMTNSKLKIAILTFEHHSRKEVYTCYCYVMSLFHK